MGERGYKILLLTDAYPPEVRSSAILMESLARGLSEFGHDVVVLTSAAQHNVPSSPTRRLPEQSKSKEQGAGTPRVLRLKTFPFHNVHPLLRVPGEVSMVLSSIMAGLRLQRPDVIVAYTPPLSVGIGAALLKALFSGVPLVSLVQDLYPHTPEMLGFLRSRALRLAVSQASRFFLKRTDLAVCHSEGNARELRRTQVFSDRPSAVRVIPNFVDTSEWPNEAHVRAVLDTLAIPGQKKIFLFGGVLGYAQDVETIVRAAGLLKEREDLLFVVVGRGVSKSRIERLARGLGNFRLLDLMPLCDFRALVEAAYAGLVTLSPRLRTPVVPSKLLEFMAAGKPVVLSVPEESDAVEIVEQADCGIHVPAGSPKELADACLWLAKHEELAAKRGQNARLYFQRHFTRGSVICAYHDMICDLLEELGRHGGAR